MSNMTLWILIGVGEVLLIIIGLLFTAWIRSEMAKGRDRKAVQQLVTRVQKSKQEREEAIREFLGQNYQLEGDDLKKATSGIARKEMRLVQEVANLYRRRDSGRLVQFPLAYEAAVEPYWDLEGGPSVESATTGEGEEDPELARLRDDNQRLSDELQITMDTMSRMLSEYSAMFAGAAPGDVAGTEVGVISEEITNTAEGIETAGASEPKPEESGSIAGADDVVEDEIEQILSESTESETVVDTGEQPVAPEPDVGDATLLDADGLFDTEPEEVASIAPEANEKADDSAESVLDADGLFDVEPIENEASAEEDPDKQDDDQIAI